MNEDKLISLLRMTEQAESVQENELMALLSDKETRAYYETLVMLKQAFQVSAAAPSNNRFHSILRNHSWSRIVATTVIALFAMGSIVLATVYFWNVRSREIPTAVEEQRSTMDKGLFVDKKSLPADKSKKTYDNEPLEVILSDIANYYGLDVKYSSQQTSSLRMHFVWNPADNINTVIEIFNHFDHIEIYREGNTLYVK